MTATGIEPTTTMFEDEHSTIYPNWPKGVHLEGVHFQWSCKRLVCNFNSKRTPSLPAILLKMNSSTPLLHA